MKTHSLMLMALLLLCLGTTAIGQVSWTAQYMGRGEYRHGFQTPAATNADPAYFVGQRARIGMKYTSEKFRLNVAAQDVRTWGQTANSTMDVSGLFSIQEANAELFLNKHMTIKAGRQEIAYDEDRIFGSLDWSLQARRHDAAIFKYQDSTWKADAGFAYNQDKEQSNTTLYTVANNYKTFQYAYVSKQIKALNLSFLFLNNGLQWTQKDTANVITGSGVRFSQTVGLRGAYTKGKLGANATFYYQMGKDVADKDLGAYEASAEVSYKPIDKLKLILGGEILSGTSQTDTANKANHSFTPFYGTNHRFNGYMDLFYVGNFANSVGLMDPYFKAVFSTKKVIAAAEAHFFMAAADIRDRSSLTEIKAMPAYMGTEVDVTLLYNFADFVSVQAGYSIMLPTASFAAVRGGDINERQDWAYVMLLVRPGMIKFPKSGLKL
jgi:Alginate export